MKYKVFEQVSFLGRNGYRPMDKIRKKIGLLLSDTEFEFYSIDTPKVPVSQLNEYDYNVTTKRNFYDKITWGFKIFTTLMFNNYDIFHSFVEPISLIIYHQIKLRNPKIKHILTVHGLPFKGATWDGKKIFPNKKEINGRKILNKLIKKADIVTGCGYHTTEELKREYNIDSLAMPDGVDTKQFSLKTERQYDKFKFLYVGSFQKRKNVLTSIHLAKAFPHADIMLVGRGILLNEIKKYAKKFSNIHIYDQYLTYDNLIQLYNEANIFFFPSLHEGLANALLEAISSELPVLAANATSNPELVIEGKNGFLFSSTNEMIEKAKLLFDESLLKEMGKNSRKIALKYDWNEVSKKHYEIFKKAININK